LQGAEGAGGHWGSARGEPRNVLRSPATAVRDLLSGNAPPNPQAERGGGDTLKRVAEVGLGRAKRREPVWQTSDLRRGTGGCMLCSGVGKTTGMS
jgi:hypothetical protein